MPSIYDKGQIKYAKNTERIAKFYPPWTQIRRNKESVGHQFLNAFGLELDELELFLNNALNNQFIGTANLGEIFEIYKFSIHGIDEDTELKDITGEINGESIPLSETVSLREFYSNIKDEDGNPTIIPDNIIFDFENNLCYLRKRYDKVSILNNDYSTIHYHHVWNVFDEFALLLGLRRRYFENGIESNIDLKERILNVFRFPANSQYIGLINGIGQSLGLINIDTWNEQEDYFLVSDTTVEPETILINGEPLQEGQWTIINEDIKLLPELKVFPRKDFEYRTNNVEMVNGEFQLVSGSKEGSFVTPVLYANNINAWKSITTTYSGNVTIQVLPFNFDNLLEDYKYYDGNPNAILSEEISHPIKIKFTLRRNLREDPSPKVSSCSISYQHRTSEIRYIHSTQVDAMHDESFRNKELFSGEGLPTFEMKRYVQELSEVAPILWDNFKWDEAYWDVIDENLMGLEALPSRWDPNLGEKVNRYLKNGIGFGNDLKLKSNDNYWNLHIHNGYYYIGPKAQEHFLYAFDEEVISKDTNVMVLPEGLNQGAPVIVIADGKYLTQVSFLDEEYNFTIKNTETLIADDSGFFYLSYSNPVNIETNTESSVSVVEGNKISLNPSVDTGTEITFSYKMKDSFVIVDNYTILLSDTYQDVRVIYEKAMDTSFRKIDSIDLNPIINHIPMGFVYLTDKLEEPSKLVASAHPDFLKADGYDVSTIVVDVFDRWNNPIIEEDVAVQELNQDGSEGIIEKTAQHYNRHIFRYTAPNEPKDITLVFSAKDKVHTSIILKVR